MDPAKSITQADLDAAFGGESIANRKYLFFADVAKRLGHGDLAKIFRDTAAQGTVHAFAHFRLLHPELELAIEGETYEFTTMYPRVRGPSPQRSG